MKYREIANIRSEKMQCSIEALSKFLEEIEKSHPELVEKELIHQIGIFNENHFDETSAHYVIEKMRSSINPNRAPFEILEEKGITKDRSKQRIEEAYHKAREFANERNMSAPTIPEAYNEWDYYVVLAMCAMDYWYEGMENSSCTDMLAYEFMADVDASTAKVWDYFFK